MRTLILPLHVLAIALCLLLAGTSSGAVDAASLPRAAKYAVVVNLANKVEFKDDDAAKHEVKKLFLKNATEWTGGLEAKPFARDEGDDAQVAFIESVLGMDKAELARHWVSAKNKNGITPPKEVGSDKMLGKYVGKYDGGLGIMELDAAKKADVRVLIEF